MRYVSGKTRIAKNIAMVIRERERVNENFVSLFCGGLSVETRLAPLFNNVIINDKQHYLIDLYKAVQSGWNPPNSLSEEEYKYIKAHPNENPALTGFAAFGCSFGGKYFAGYGRHGTKDNHAKEKSMCEESKRALLRDIEILKDAKFISMDYHEVELPDNCVIYCDPPYSGKMAAYGLEEDFNNDEFWEWCRNHSNSSCHIYISELSAPEDFVCIWEKSVLRQIANCNAENFKATEKLFVYKG